MNKLSLLTVICAEKEIRIKYMGPIYYILFTIVKFIKPYNLFLIHDVLDCVALLIANTNSFSLTNH